MFKINNKDSRRRSGVFIINFEHIPQHVLVSLLLTLSRQMVAGQNKRIWTLFGNMRIHHWTFRSNVPNVLKRVATMKTCI